MTTIEKAIVHEALKDYKDTADELAYIYREQGDVERAVKYSILSTQTKAILTYWCDVENQPSGTVTI